MQEKMHLTQHPGLNPPSFEARITDVLDDGVYLDRTFCYPRGGGQPGDKGTIASIDKTSHMGEVKPGDSILHPLESPELFEIGDKIDCEIDSFWRNRNTKMHTAQHVFSAIANDMYNAETVGNQISDKTTRIDLWFPDRDLFDPEEITLQVNDVLNSGADVLIHKWSREEILSHDMMRHTNFMDRIPSSISMLRVVEIEEIDLCPCGGTHVGNISDIPEINIVNVKSKGAGKLRISYN